MRLDRARTDLSRTGIPLHARHHRYWPPSMPWAVLIGAMRAHRIPSRGRNEQADRGNSHGAGHHNVEVGDRGATVKTRRGEDQQSDAARHEQAVGAKAPEQMPRTFS